MTSSNSSKRPRPCSLARYMAASASRSSVEELASRAPATATPTEPVTYTSSTPSGNECIQASPSRLAAASASASEVRSSTSTANSSPPRRAMQSWAPIAARSRGGTAISSESPVWCPSESLMTLNWSRSTISSATSVPVGAGAAQRGVDPLDEVRAVGEPGERVLERHAGASRPRSSGGRGRRSAGGRPSAGRSRRRRRSRPGSALCTHRRPNATRAPIHTCISLRGFAHSPVSATTASSSAASTTRAVGAQRRADDRRRRAEHLVDVVDLQRATAELGDGFYGRGVRHAPVVGGNRPRPRGRRRWRAPPRPPAARAGTRSARAAWSTASGGPRRSRARSGRRGSRTPAPG